MTQFRDIFLSIVMVAACLDATAQKKKEARPKAASAPITLYRDSYRGTFPRGSDSEIVMLQLDHKIATDERLFDMDILVRQQGGPNLGKKYQGAWSEMTGRPDDDQAQMILLHTPDEIFFFLKENDSTLRKLTPDMHDLEPKERYLLRKGKYDQGTPRDTTTESDRAMQSLAGTYKGKLPCTDCNSILSSLSLKYRLHAKAGDYVLTDKYVGTKSGDVTNERKGKWSFTTRQVESDRRSHVIILDPEKKGRETYYLVRRDGSTIQVDKNMKRPDSQKDQSLRR